MPRPHKGQSKEDFISEYVSSPEAMKQFPEDKQRVAIAENLWRKHLENPKKKMEMPGMGEFPSGSTTYVPGLKKKDAERKYKR